MRQFLKIKLYTTAGKKRVVLYQLVSTPFKHTLEQRDRRLVRAQVWMKHTIYGGLCSRMLPLVQEKSGRRISADMLFQNGERGRVRFPTSVQDEKLVEIAVSNVKYG